jgi:hypothetical protein
MSKELMRENFNLLLLLSVFLLYFSSCKRSDQPANYHEYPFDFSDGSQGWFSLFADYPKNNESFYELEFTPAHLPSPLDTTIMAVRMSGNNHSDDLMSFMFRRVDHLYPLTTYQVTFDITLASNVAKNSIGAGGSPDLALGVGGLNFQPGRTLDDSGWYRPEFTTLLQSYQSNEVTQMIGTIGVTDTTTQYTLINLNNLHNPMNLTSDEYGELWFLIGTDSGFEGKTTIYFKSIVIKMRYYN